MKTFFLSGIATAISHVLGGFILGVCSKGMDEGMMAGIVFIIFGFPVLLIEFISVVIGISILDSRPWLRPILIKVFALIGLAFSIGSFLLYPKGGFLGLWLALCVGMLTVCIIHWWGDLGEESNQTEQAVAPDGE